jgi:hypothetical protein
VAAAVGGDAADDAEPAGLAPGRPRPEAEAEAPVAPKACTMPLYWSPVNTRPPPGENATAWTKRNTPPPLGASPTIDAERAAGGGGGMSV